MAKKSLRVIKYILRKPQFASCCSCNFRHERVHLRLGVHMTQQLSTHLTSLPLWLLTLNTYSPSSSMTQTLVHGTLIFCLGAFCSLQSRFPHPILASIMVNFLHTRQRDILRIESDFIIFFLKPLKQVPITFSLL